MLNISRLLKKEKKSGWTYSLVVIAAPLIDKYTFAMNFYFIINNQITIINKMIPQSQSLALLSIASKRCSQKCSIFTAELN